jgi:hypothetical protein
MRSIRISDVAIWLIVLFLAMTLIRPMYLPQVTASADSATFDHVHVVAPLFLYKGKQGLLLLDKRNGNVWFVGKEGELDLKYGDPVFITHIPLEKLHP